MASKNVQIIPARALSMLKGREPFIFLCRIYVVIGILTFMLPDSMHTVLLALC
jgi:hypothetical protein